MELTRRVPTRPLLKVCGAVDTTEIDVLAAGGADLVGLWCGVPGGRADVPVPRAAALAAHARHVGVTPVLVTFLGGAERLADVVASTGVAVVQLHAYQPPALVAALRAAVGPDVVLVKVLHAAGGRCVERRFVPAYERGGVDAFLLDAVAGDADSDIAPSHAAGHQVGSTGQRLSPLVVNDLVAATTRPFLLAGGITDDPAEHARFAEHPRFVGVDVDTGARDGSDRVDPRRVRSIARAWAALAAPMAGVAG